MLEECVDDNAGNREALQYGEQLKVDILAHVLDIINESNLENKNLHNDLTIKADIEKQRLFRIQQEKTNQDMQT